MSKHLRKSATLAVFASLAIVPVFAQTPDRITPEPRPIAPKTLPLQTGPSGIITTIAGDGYIGDSGNGGPAAKAQFILPAAVAVDGEGNLFILDDSAGVVRKVTASTGEISNYAGTGEGGYAGDNGLATAAELNNPSAIAVDSAGNLYISDFDNNVIRKVNAKTGIITTVVGNGDGSATPPVGDRTCEPRIDGVAATKTPLCGPFGIAFDAYENLYFSDFENHVIRKVTAKTGIISTVAGTGVITTPNGNGNFGYAGDGGPALEAQLSFPTGVALDKVGNLYILDAVNCAVRKVTAKTGIITSLLGTLSPGGYFGVCGASFDGIPASQALINQFSTGIAVDASGNILIVDNGNQLIRNIAASNGTIYTVAGSRLPGNNRPGEAGYSGDGGPAVDALLSSPAGAAFDGAGDLYFADSDNRVIRKVTSASVLPTESPVISPVSGAITGATPITIKSPVVGATIYYTTNGSIPTTKSTKYIGEFSVDQSTVVSAFSTIPGKPNTQAAIAAYLDAPAPVIAPGSKTITSATKITLTDANPLAKIYYTTDPLGYPASTNSGTLYTGPFTIASATTVQAAALVSVTDANGNVYSGWSAISSATYTNPAARAPSATTAAADVTAGWITFKGNVTANGAATDFLFLVGTNSGSLNDGFGGGYAVVGTNSTAVSATWSASFLQPMTTYYYKIVATNAVGAADGGILSFTTK